MTKNQNARKKRSRKEGIKIVHKIIVAPESVKASHRTAHGPEPERFKISGYANWEDAVKVALHKKKPARGWPKK
jgi:hypothetical protein